jgi:outer membrane phospholipase A
LSPDAENAQLGRTFAGRMAAHEPVYFVYGDESQAAKFQLSFKYKLAEFGERTVETTPSTLQMAYTQRSLWDIDGDSSPFYDTSYMPEIFWEWMKLPIAVDTNDSPWFGLQAGYKHESNGRDGSDSRSLNTAFARAFFAFGPPGGWRVALIPEIFTYLGSMGENEDIDLYRGYGLLRAVVAKADGPSLMFTGMAGKDFNHASFQLDLTFPVRTRFLDMSVFFLVQYYNGYGESLRSYNLKSEALRAGFSLVR